MWCIAELTPAYVENMEDVLGIYEKPYNPAQPVVCLDEKPISLHSDVRPPVAAKPGKAAKQDNEYGRCGTANVFGVVEQYPDAKTIHLVMENLNIHGRKSLTDYYGDEEGKWIWGRLTVHYTPKHGSWLNQAEIELSMYSHQCLGTRRIPDLAKLEREAKAWNYEANQKRTKINWRYTRKKARKHFKYEPPRRGR